MSKEKLTKCPKCGDENGYFEKLIEARNHHFLWSGEESESTAPDLISGGERKYCTGCQKDITKYLDA